MADDAAGGAPQARGGGGIAGMPLWVWGVGLAGVLAFFYWRSHHATSSAALGATTTPLSGATTGIVTDPNTGLPVDPLTGLPYLTSQPSTSTQTLTGWANAAFAALVKAGFQPGAVEKALYDFLNGNPLVHNDANIINQAMKLVGQPPDLLPFFGTVPNPKPKKPPIRKPAPPHLRATPRPKGTLPGPGPRLPYPSNLVPAQQV